MGSIPQPTYWASFTILFTLTLFVNKYVLSILSFTYPTIFQGWQTMVGALLLNGASNLNIVNIPLQRPTRREVALWMPGMLCYVVMIYSASVALANLSVPVFLATTNLSYVLCYVTHSKSVHRNSLVSCYVCHMTLFISVIGLAISDPQYSRQGYTWLCVNIVSSGILEIYNHVSGERLNLSAFQRLNMNYVYSVIVLAPSCYFLGDALEARKFPYLYFTKFYIGCVLSGVFGVSLSVLSITTKHQQPFPHIHFDLWIVITKVLAMLLSLLLFSVQVTYSHMAWITVNFTTSLLSLYIYHNDITARPPVIGNIINT